MPQICAFGEAVKHMMTEKEALTHVKAVQTHLIERLKAMPEVVLNSPENALPYIVNLSAGRVRAETMLHFWRSETFLFQAVPRAARQNRATF